MALPKKNQHNPTDDIMVVDAQTIPKPILAVAVLNIDSFSISQLPEYQGKKEEIQSVIKANPIVEIIDATTYEAMKKSRTAVRSLRTSLEKEQTDVKKKIKEKILNVVDKEYETLIVDVKNEESNRQDLITAYEAKKEQERKDKEEAEEKRIANINKIITDYVAHWKTTFNLMVFDTLEETAALFLESHTTFDLAVLEEFKDLFPSKVNEIKNYYTERSNILIQAEEARVEQVKKDLELKRTRELIAAGFSFDGNNYYVSDFKKLDMPTILTQSDSSFEEIINAGIVELKRLSDIKTAKLVKAEEEKEAIFKIRKNRLLELGMVYSDKDNAMFLADDDDFVLSCNDIKNYGAIAFEETIELAKVANQAISDVKNKSLILVPTENIEPTNIVETPQEIDKNISVSNTDYPNTISGSVKLITWLDIIEYFKLSGEKSYSKWLIDNYNVPSKINQ